MIRISSYILALSIVLGPHHVVAQTGTATDSEKRVVEACKKYIGAVEKLSTEAIEALDDKRKKDYENCKALITQYGSLNTLEKEFRNKEASNKALREENAELLKGNYEIALENFLKIAAKGSKWSTENACKILFVDLKGQVVQIDPAGLELEDTRIFGSEKIRLYPNDKQGLQKVLDRKFNTKTLRRFDYPLNTSALEGLGTPQEVEEIVQNVVNGLQSMQDYCVSLAN